jgi:tape measure domain-containing protein
MATDMERLVVSLEARVRGFQNDLAKANATAQKQLRSIETQFDKTNKKLGKGLKFGGVSGGGLAAAAGGLFAADKIKDYADAWTVAGNKIAAASAVSGRAGRSLEDLNKIATETRSGITDTADLYAKLLRATSGVAKSEQEVADATEIVNKAFKAGGASASEQAAGVLQLSQALSSGVLQGDELRSIRENAPLIAQAIATEFQTTIGGLKQLGADGKLTVDRVFKAILNAKPVVDRAYGSTTATIADGFTLVENAVTQAVGKLNEATGAGKDVGETLADVASIIDTLSAAFVGIAGSPAGKFLGFLNDVIKKLDPVQNGLKLLADHGKEIVDSIAPKGGPDLGELDKLYARIRKGAEAGIIPPELMKSLDDLREKLVAGTIDADAAKKAIAAIADGHPELEQLPKLFDPLLDNLKDVVAEARKARDALADIPDDPRAAGFAMKSNDEKTAKFFSDRDADAKRTELEKQIDTRAKAIVEAAEKLGISLTEAAAKIQAKSEIAAESVSKSAGNSADTIKNFESFRAKPYWDVNAYRAGYGSDTVTLSDGTVQKVTKGITVSLEDATRDLDRRIGEFQSGIKSKIGADTFNGMNDQQQAALTSIAYNYGSLPDRIVQAIQTGSTEQVYTAIKGLGSDNGGINKDRRNSEAQMFISGAPEGIKKGIDNQEDFAKRLEEQKAYIASLQAETGIRATLNPLVNDYGQALSTLDAAQQLLTAAQQEGTAAGTELKDVQQLLYGDISKLSPAAQEQALAMRELAKQTGVAEAAGNQLSDSNDKLKQSMSESSAFGKDLLGGFISDLREGKSATEALSNALDKVADKLIDMALNTLFDGATPGSGGGILGGLFSFLFPAKNGGVYANGRPQPYKTFGRGGVSRTAAVFGEAGPEAAVPLPDGRRIPVDLRGPAGGSGGGTKVIVNQKVINNSGASVRQEQQSNDDGSIDLVTIVDDIVADRLGRPGTNSSRTLGGRFGAKPVLKRR